jgi:hypothetical protein
MQVQMNICFGDATTVPIQYLKYTNKTHIVNWRGYIPYTCVVYQPIDYAVTIVNEYFNNLEKRNSLRNVHSVVLKIPIANPRNFGRNNLEVFKE